MWLLNKLMLGCEEASFLVSKKGESNLVLKEKIQLQMHLLACKVCQHFEEQSVFIDEKTKKMYQNNSNKENSMSPESKSKLKDILKNS